MKLNKITKFSFVGVVGCFGLLGLLVVAMLCPMRSEGASAVDCTATSTDPDCAISTAAVDVGANVATVISIGLDPRVDIDVTPTASGAFSSATTNLTVATNNPTGYKVYMKTTNGSSQLSGTGTNSSKITAVTSGATPGSATFKNNTWGYNLSASSATIGNSTPYKPVPVNTNDTITTGTGMSGAYKLTFGAKVDSTLPTDTYSNSVVVSAVANPTEITKLTQLTYMQDMNSSICSGSSEGETKQLIDSRDGKRYYVAKMKDGNCWMTQNLDLDITTTGLKAADTNITADWNSSSQYPPSQTETSVPERVDSPSQTTTFSWDLGQWVLATPTKTASCGDVTDIAACEKVGFVNVSGSEWKPTFQAQQGKYTGPGDYANETTYIAVDYEGKTYDPHYLIGNYYQWNTATAGTGGVITSADASGSVCPKNWKLPTSGDSTSNLKDDSFASLLVQYGVASSLTGTVGGVTYNIAEAPLYFVRSGYISRGSSKALYLPGLNGFYWSSYTDGQYTTWLIVFNGSNVSSDFSTMSFGLPLRCLAS